MIDPTLTRHAATVAIGGTVAFDAQFGGPVTGASVNLARSLAPALGAVGYQLVRDDHHLTKNQFTKTTA